MFRFFFFLPFSMLRVLQGVQRYFPTVAKESELRPHNILALSNTQEIHLCSFKCYFAKLKKN